MKSQVIDVRCGQVVSSCTLGAGGSYFDSRCVSCMCLGILYGIGETVERPSGEFFFIMIK